MKNLVYNISLVAVVATLIGLTFGACTGDSNDPETEYALWLPGVEDVVWDLGEEYEEVYVVTYDGATPEGEVIATVTIDGLPTGINTTIQYFNIGDPTDGTVPPLSTPTPPYQAAVKYDVESSATLGTAAVTITVSSGEEGVNPVSQTFMLTVTDPGTGGTDCNTALAGNYAGPGNCSPPGWGDTHVDVFVTTDPNNVDVYVEFFDQGSNMAATLDCGNSSFTIPQQTVTAGNGAQQLNVEGSGTWVFGQGDTTIVLIYQWQVAGSSDPPTTCQIDLTKL